jgi:tRNA(Ile)-lysidine synthase
VTDLLQRVEESIQNRRLLKRGDRLLVAVSGGLDSMALLHSLHKLSSRHRWKLAVAHFNHRLRGRSSDADEKLVRRTAAALKHPFVSGWADVKGFARTSKLSVEMAARRLRHEFLARAAKERQIRAVALAHHADDQVELFFLRLLRGTGGEGLAGMKWRSPSPANSKITLVRPLLNASKDELRRFARENKIHFREDATNVSIDFLRNRIRNELLPLLRKNYQPALNQTVLRLMEITGAEAEFVNEAAKSFCRRRGLPGRSFGAKTGDESQIKIGSRKMENMSEPPHVGSCGFEHLPAALQRRVLQSQLINLGVPTDFKLVEQLRKAADVQISAGSGFFAVRDAAGRVSLRTQPSAPFNARETVLKPAGRAGGAMFDGVRLDWRFRSGAGFVRPRRQAAQEIFDADRVGGSIRLRHWRSGDRFQPIGLASPVKLQDLFTNLKIPRSRRRELVVAVAGNGEIFWVEGLRISEQFKLTPQTRRCLVWRWRPFKRAVFL